MKEKIYEKTGIYIKDGRIRADTTKAKIYFSIPIYIVGSIVFYYAMTGIDASETTRVSGAIFRLMLAIASPLFWAGLMVFVGTLDIMRLLFLLARERRLENK